MPDLICPCFLGIRVARAVKARQYLRGKFSSFILTEPQGFSQDRFSRLCHAREITVSHGPQQGRFQQLR